MKDPNHISPTALAIVFALFLLALAIEWVIKNRAAKRKAAARAANRFLNL